MLITLNQLKASLVAFKNWVLARIPSKTSDLTNDSGFITAEDETVKDVRVNRTSILNEGVANIPVATLSALGVVKANKSYGTTVSNAGTIATNPASEEIIKAGSDSFCPIAAKTQHASVFYGLAKAAGHDEKDSANPVGTYTEEAKTAIRSMLDVPSVDDIPEAPVQDVQVNNASLLDSEGVANIPIASTTDAGVVKIGSVSTGLKMVSEVLYVTAATRSMIKNGSPTMQPIIPASQHESVFYGLAKAAGHDEKDSTLAVGTYTDSAKTAIKTMLGVEDPVDVQINGTSIVNNGVANIPKASSSAFGAVKTVEINGVYTNADGFLTLTNATDLAVKLGNNTKYAVNTAKQHQSVFYGLAKAAGDTTQSSSSNPVGTYTDEAKTAIKTMLGISEVQTVTVSGTDPVITAEDNHRYVCGEVTSLSFTPCASGICDVIFTSGSTVAVLTLPSTVKMPDGFEVEANVTYEINILDGVWGVYQAWVN